MGIFSFDCAELLMIVTSLLYGEAHAVLPLTIENNESAAYLGLLGELISVARHAYPTR